MSSLETLTVCSVPSVDLTTTVLVASSTLVTVPCSTFTVSSAANAAIASAININASCLGLVIRVAPPTGARIVTRSRTALNWPETNRQDLTQGTGRFDRPRAAIRTDQQLTSSLQPAHESFSPRVRLSTP